MKVTVIPIVISALSTVTKRLVHGLEDIEIRGRVDSIQINALLRSARILGSPGDSRRLTVAQTPVENNQLTLL